MGGPPLIFFIIIKMEKVMTYTKIKFYILI